MSTCISRKGEFSSHTTSKGSFICDDCGVLDEEGIFPELDRLRALEAAHKDAIPATHSPEQGESGLPTDQGAREALVERLAIALYAHGEEMTIHEADDLWDLGDGWEPYIETARAIAPQVAAEVEAAVSVVRARVADREETIRRLTTEIGGLREQDALHINVMAGEVRALREKVAKVEALADSMEWKRPEKCPCDNPEACCGSEESCDAMQPSVRVVGVATLRAALFDPTTPDQTGGE